MPAVKDCKGRTEAKCSAYDGCYWAPKAKHCRSMPYVGSKRVKGGARKAAQSSCAGRSKRKCLKKKASLGCRYYSGESRSYCRILRGASKTKIGKITVGGKERSLYKGRNGGKFYRKTSDGKTYRVYVESKKRV